MLDVVPIEEEGSPFVGPLRSSRREGGRLSISN
jgi:hypothetical protein